MRPFPQSAVALLCALALGSAASLYAQTPVQVPPQSQPKTPASPGLNHNLIVLDPAHGGSDSGAKLGDQLLEKDLTLALASRLRAALAAEGFTVISTRDTDSTTPLPNDQRAELANRTHAVACLVIHATASGSGVHLYTSALDPPEPAYDFGLNGSATGGQEEPSSFKPTPWDQAQAASIRQSLHLAADLITALQTGSIPLITGRVSMRPLDNLTCPAVAIELAPLVVPGGNTTPVTDAGYQQRVIEAVTRALVFWRGHPDSPTPKAAGPTNSTPPQPADHPPAKAATARTSGTTGATGTIPAPTLGPDGAPLKKAAPKPIPKPTPPVGPPPATPDPGARP